MEGIVFTLLEDVLSTAHGSALWDAALEDAEVPGAYTAVGTYPDGELEAIVAAAAVRLDASRDAVLRTGGRAMLPHFADRFPELFDRYGDPRSFALALNHVIHPTVRRRLPDAAPPPLRFDTRSPVTLGVHYRSKRRMCAFAEGLLLGLGDHYERPVLVEHATCMLHGDADCRLEMTVA